MRTERLRYQHLFYSAWWVAAVFCGVAGVFCLVLGWWGWVLGWTVGALACAAHGRLERFDGHSHKGVNVEVPQ